MVRGTSDYYILLRKGVWVEVAPPLHEGILKNNHSLFPLRARRAAKEAKDAPAQPALVSDIPVALTRNFQNFFKKFREYLREFRKIGEI